MKKEEILEANKKDNKKQDEYEVEIGRNATKIGGFFALVLTTTYYCYEIFTGKGTNPAFYSIITSFCAGTYIYMGIKKDRNKTTNMFAGIVWLLLTIILVVTYFIGK